jgi:hypothetical protein
MYRFDRSSAQNGFRSDTPLTNDQIARFAPSVMATEPHASRGPRYSVIPTIEVLDGLRREGFQPFEVRQTRVRKEDKRDFTKHMVRMRHPDALGDNAEVPEIVLVNSHDGTSSYQLLAGFFRMVCSNGLISGNVVNDVKVRHAGNIVDNVIEGSYRVLENIEALEERIDLYKSIQLEHPQQLALTKAATQLRWGDNAPEMVAESLNYARRAEDASASLWATFNRAQENLIRGGFATRSASGRRTRTRAIGSVNEDIKLNRALWTLADELAKAVQ